ncbi:hypothetical protein K439DRAFT_1536047 [Ramaria rubella]|nr:hypothetical protein K439DRAFT_1536047 [Ramaria rubella]
MFAWLLCCISTLSMAKCTPQVLNTKQLAQLSVCKCTTTFVDVHDDLETKIGHLSRRLNFLMTELDLWHEKFMFITFKHYAEKLSDEAAELRVKINKGWKESKRLSSLITLTVMEKYKLKECKCQLSQHCVVHVSPRFVSSRAA